MQKRILTEKGQNEMFALFVLGLGFDNSLAVLKKNGYDTIDIHNAKHLINFLKYIRDEIGYESVFSMFRNIEFPPNIIQSMQNVFDNNSVLLQ
jgi:hypothetical protein